MRDDVREALQQVARERAELHGQHASSRPLSEGYEECGLAGEFAFAHDFHLPLDWTRRPAGDSGIDFWVPMLFSLDVKTARKPLNLAVEKGKVAADIYVLAGFADDVLRAKLLGWEWGEAVRAAPLRDLGYGILSHCIPAGLLRPMAELKRRIAIIGFRAP